MAKKIYADSHKVTVTVPKDRRGRKSKARGPEVYYGPFSRTEDDQPLVKKTGFMSFHDLSVQLGQVVLPGTSFKGSRLQYSPVVWIGGVSGEGGDDVETSVLALYMASFGLVDVKHFFSRTPGDFEVYRRDFSKLPLPRRQVDFVGLRVRAGGTSYSIEGATPSWASPSTAQQRLDIELAKDSPDPDLVRFLQWEVGETASPYATGETTWEPNSDLVDGDGVDDTGFSARLYDWVSTDSRGILKYASLGGNKGLEVTDGGGYYEEFSISDSATYKYTHGSTYASASVPAPELKLDKPTQVLLAPRVWEVEFVYQARITNGPSISDQANLPVSGKFRMLAQGHLSPYFVNASALTMLPASSDLPAYRPPVRVPSSRDGAFVYVCSQAQPHLFLQEFYKSRRKDAQRVMELATTPNSGWANNYRFYLSGDQVRRPDLLPPGYMYWQGKGSCDADPGAETPAVFYFGTSLRTTVKVLPKTRAHSLVGGVRIDGQVTWVWLREERVYGPRTVLDNTANFWGVPTYPLTQQLGTPASRT